MGPLLIPTARVPDYGNTLMLGAILLLSLSQPLSLSDGQILPPSLML